MADGSGASGMVTRARVRKPVLGRMSVFVIGILIGAVLGVCLVVFGGPLLDEVDPTAFASAPALGSGATDRRSAGADGIESSRTEPRSACAMEFGSA